ncbi:MAG TPA: hypothetical protein PLY93_02250 [Turneriella sp.]|nr:hypothetical protein [Turneriella sp.]
MVESPNETAEKAAVAPPKTNRRTESNASWLQQVKTDDSLRLEAEMVTLELKLFEMKSLPSVS